MASSPITSWQIDRDKIEVVTDLIFFVSKITEDGDYTHEFKKLLSLGRKAMTNLDIILQSRDITLPTKALIVKAMLFFSSHIQMWKLDHKEGCVPKKWCFQIVVLEKILESPVDFKEIKPVNPKRTQPWIFIGRIDAEAEAPVPWPADVKSWHWKRPWCWETLRAEGEGGDSGCHHQLDGHEFEQTLEDNEG